jgi:signal transduction histidine kinase
MGLSISRSIVQAHGGRIWATRNADHGLTLQFTLPESTPSATYTKV